MSEPKLHACPQCKSRDLEVEGRAWFRIENDDKAGDFAGDMADASCQFDSNDSVYCLACSFTSIRSDFQTEEKGATDGQ